MSRNQSQYESSGSVTSILKRGSDASFRKGKKDATPLYFANFSNRLIQRISNEQELGWRGLIKTVKEFFILESGSFAYARLSGAMASVILAVFIFTKASDLQTEQAPVMAKLNAVKLERQILFAVKHSEEDLTSLSVWQFAAGFTASEAEVNAEKDLAVSEFSMEELSRAFEAAESESTDEEEGDAYQTLSPEDIQTLIQTL
ncbi:MAG: hypothetical protein SFU91_14220 [Chloroherpetonaceae bacterium]|nr:hypothetical protein [Chloroherpetonaceae bacterium]